MSSMETDDAKMEEILLKNGFSPENIAHMKKIIERGQIPDETLYKLTLELKDRFIRGCFISFLCSLPFFYYLITGSLISITSSFIVTLFSLAVIFYIGPINLTWKAYSFIKKLKE
ncbi:hypothetical protein [Enterobacillus tribolii]|uniref:hypothetical protein n=1 Tax=Enterobacillus tribolii TaxID=1487935 RepID=UPI000E1CE513|nr:hypothetical protein [Enterobacillus tribolii]MBW7981298.1 hypothetical protein [Enterobacillus tribolii]